MSGDREEGGRDRSRSVPIDAMPDPVLGYELQDGEALVATTNDAFESAFGSVSAGTTLRRWLHSATDADEPIVEGVRSSLAERDPVDTEFDVTGADAAAGPYRLRTLGSATDDASDGDGEDDGVAGGGTTGGAVDGYVVLSELRPSTAGGADVDRIASVVSHDLRNPLDVANAHLRAARETGDDEHFEAVRAAHERMERIVRDVLTLARGEHALNVADAVDIGAVATDAWDAVDTGGASLTVADDLPAVDADPDRLQRLFENLFRNAVEHASPSPETGTTGPDPGPGSDEVLQVRVGPTDRGWFVADDGVGVPEDERERVFEPGYSTGDSGSGTGLGLTIVERIAEAHDWTVSLTTGPPGGARFEFHAVETEE
jgi:signal transduction histidine kinase